MHNVRKAFGAVQALDGVDLTVRSGEVHALIGENGAGKSTLMKVLSGAYTPDAGTMELDGKPYRPNGPLSARKQGVSMIYQELNLALHLSVEANIMLGREEHRFGFIWRERTRQRVSRALQILDQSQIAPQLLLSELGPAERQLVEIARALVGEARIVVMDEPTSSLSRKDTERLFGVVRRLRDQGVAVIYISHFLEEVKRVADRYTVLRDGRTVASGDVSSTDIETIIEQMVGRKIGEIFPEVISHPREEILRLDELSCEPSPRAVNLNLYRGEILGIAGLVGAGRTELIRAVAGLKPVKSGRITVAGITDTGLSTHQRLCQGVGMLSENRKDEGLAFDLSVEENITLSHPEPFLRWGWIDRRKREQLTQKWIEELSIRCLNSRQLVGELSGGNQQKTALSRLLHHDVDVLLLDEPTRGIDVGSKVEIYKLMRRLAAQGKAILFVSSYIPELLGVCDRLAVMHRGELGKARKAEQWTETAVLDEAARGVI